MNIKMTSIKKLISFPASALLALVLCSTTTSTSASASTYEEEVKIIAQKLKGEYKNPSGQTTTLTAEQTTQLLKGESVKIDDKTDLQFSKKQLEQKEKLTTEDINNLLRGTKSDKKH